MTPSRYRYRRRAHPGAVRRQDHDRPHLARRLDQGCEPGRRYLLDHGVQPADFNQYGTRRGNHEVMMRGTFANIRIKNLHGEGCDRQREGRRPDDPLSLRPRRCRSTTPRCSTKTEGVPLVVFAGIEYGNGSSRDWAAKGTNLLGVRAVIAQSFERIHRSNLVGMGVVPFVFTEGRSWQSLGLKGDERVTISGLAQSSRAR